MLKEFKAFILRGNVVDLAVGVVIGAAFGAIINSFVNDILTPLLSMVHLPDFSRAFIDRGPEGPSAGDIRYGTLINALISFLAIAAVVFFFVVKPVNHLRGLGKSEEDPKNKPCPHCLSEIPAKAAVCAHCTREVPATA